MNSKVIGWSLVAMCAAAFAPSIVAQQARVSPHETHSSLVDGATITITLRSAVDAWTEDFR